MKLIVLLVSFQPYSVTVKYSPTPSGTISMETCVISQSSTAKSTITSFTEVSSVKTGSTDGTGSGSSGAAYLTAGLYDVTCTVEADGTTYSGTVTNQLINTGDTTFDTVSIDTPKSITCTPMITGVTISSSSPTSATCVIKSGSTTIDTVTTTSNTGTSTATFYSGTYTVEHSVVIDGQTYSASESVTFTTSDTTMTSMPTLTNQGPWKLTCTLAVSGLTLSNCGTSLTCSNECYVQSAGQTIGPWTSGDNMASSGVFTDGTYTVTGRVTITQSGGSTVVYNVGSTSVTFSGADQTATVTLSQSRRRSIWLDGPGQEIYDYYYPDSWGITEDEDYAFVQKIQNISNNHINTLYTGHRYF